MMPIPNGCSFHCFGLRQTVAGLRTDSGAQRPAGALKLSANLICQHTFRRVLKVLMVVYLACCSTGQVARAEPSPFTPQTRIRVTILQWMPTKGSYERWDSIGGEFSIADDGTVSLPVIGTLPVGDLDAAGLAKEISEAFKRKVGLVETPEATIEILERPPIYVVGDVDKPGEYRFHEGMTVLQSLAMSGGPLRSLDGSTRIKDRLGYVGELKEIASSLLRSKIKIVRLEAETSGFRDMVFDPKSESDAALAAEVFNQEKVLHVARMNEVDRQSKSYLELRGLLNVEIENLGKKLSSSDEDLSSVQTQLSKIKGLVEKGIIVPARQADLERLLRSYFSDRLDLEISIMRARQNLAETNRNLDGLHDRQETEVASALQAEKAAIEQLKIKRDLTQTLLLNTLSEDGVSGQNDVAPIFTLVRRDHGDVVEIAATSATLLHPGDVLRVTSGKPQTSPAPPVAVNDPKQDKGSPQQVTQR